MKNKKLIFLSTIICLLVVGCNEESKNNNDNQEKRIKKSYTDFSKSFYQGQLSYLKIEDEEKVNDLAIKYDFEKKIHNKNVSWEFFDEIFSEDLTITEKQNLSHIILSTKDLIGIYNKDKENKKIEEKVKFYTKTLVDSDYLGYCLLYFSLNSLNENNKNFVIENKRKVLNYSTKEDFHKTSLENEELKKPEMAMYYNKIKENHSFLERIKKMN